MQAKRNRKGMKLFNPTGKGGGSKKGKPQGQWPWSVKVVAHAIIIRDKGSKDAALNDRKWMSEVKFGRQMDVLLPGWRELMREILGERKTSLERLLMNRVYKMLYSGTSDRGKKHDPLTRASFSKEHWEHQIPVGSDLHQIHDDIVDGRITTVKNWMNIK